MSSVDTSWLLLWLFSCEAELLNECITEYMKEGITIFIAIILDLYLLHMYLLTLEHKKPNLL